MEPSEPVLGWDEWLQLLKALDEAIHADDWELSIELAERVLATQPQMPDLASLDSSETTRMAAILQEALRAVDTATMLMTKRRDELAGVLGSIRNENRLRASYGDV